MVIIQTFGRQEIVTKTKQMTNTKKHTQKWKQTCREDVGNREKTAKTLKTCSGVSCNLWRIFLLFLSFWCREFCEQKVKATTLRKMQKFIRKYFLFPFFSLNFRFSKENSAKKKFYFAFFRLLFVALSIFIFKICYHVFNYTLNFPPKKLIYIAISG